MNLRILALTTVSVTIAVAAVLTLTQMQAGSQQVRPPQVLEARYGEPAAAAAYAALKRRPIDDGPDMAERYRAARAHRKGMPKHRFETAPGRSSIRSKSTTSWESLGPGNIGGRTRTLAIRPDDAMVMFAGGVSGGLWRTDDGGESWRALADDLSNIAVNSLAFDPVDPEVLYIGTGEGHFREEQRGTWLPLRGGGIFRSTDGGDSWSILASTTGEDFLWVNDLLISPRQRNRLYAATRTGVWRSDDGGETWQQIATTDSKGGCLDLALRQDTSLDVLFAACGTLDQGSVLRSLDAAGSEPFEEVLSEPGMGRTSLALAPSNQDVIYALAASIVGGPGGTFNGGLHALFRSSDGGETWQARVRNSDPIKLNTLLLSNPAAASYLDCGWWVSNIWVNMGWYCNVLAVDPVDPNMVWAAGVDIFRSSDGGRSWGLGSSWWFPRDEPLFLHADQHRIVFHPDYDGVANRTMFIGNDGGVFRTDNARAAVSTGLDSVCDPSRSTLRWQSLNNGYEVTQFYHGAAFPGGDAYLGGAQDNGTIARRSGDGLNDWGQILGGDGAYVAVDPNDASTVFAEWQNLNLQKSTDGGVTFNDATSGLAEIDPLFITPFVMDPNDSSHLWTGGRQIWRTTSSAFLWSAASELLIGNGQVSSLAVAPGDSQFVVVGTSNGYIYRSTNAGATDRNSIWDSVRPREGFVSWLAFDPHDASVVYATFAGFGGEHVFRSADGALTWQAIDGDGTEAIPDIPVHCIVVDPNDSQRLILGTDLGVMVSIHGGQRWATENADFASVVTESLSLDITEDGPMLYAFTHGRGAWRTRLGPSRLAPRRPSGRRTPGK